MPSTEFTYKLNTIRRIAIKTLNRSIIFLFTIASLATLGLMAYEFGYAISATGKTYVIEGYKMIMRIFFFGSLINIALNPKNVWKEKGF